MASFETASRLVQAWLREEDHFQFKKFDQLSAEEITVRRKSIAEDKIPARWQRSVGLRLDKDFLHANQQLIKLSAAARAVIVCDAFLEGDTRAHASAATLRHLANHLAQISEGDLPDPVDLTNPDFESVFDVSLPMERFLRAADLSIRATLDIDQNLGFTAVPSAGQPDGKIKAIDY